MPNEEASSHVPTPARSNHQSDLPGLPEIGSKDLLVGFRQRDLTAGMRHVPTHALQALKTRIFPIQPKLLAKSCPVALRQSKGRTGSVLARSGTNCSDPYRLSFVHAV